MFVDVMHQIVFCLDDISLIPMSNMHCQMYISNSMLLNIRVNPRHLLKEPFRDLFTTVTRDNVQYLEICVFFKIQTYAYVAF